MAQYDTGANCPVSPSCLDCPLARCVKEDRTAYRRWQLQQVPNLSVDEQAASIGVTRRTILRLKAQMR